MQEHENTERFLNELGKARTITGIEATYHQYGDAMTTAKICSGAGTGLKDLYGDGRDYVVSVKKVVGEIKIADEIDIARRGSLTGVSVSYDEGGKTARLSVSYDGFYKVDGDARMELAPDVKRMLSSYGFMHGTDAA